VFDLGLAAGGEESHVRHEVRQAILDAAEFVGNEIAVKIQDPDGPMGITSYLKQVAREHSVACSLALYRSNRNQRKRSIFVFYTEKPIVIAKINPTDVDDTTALHIGAYYRSA
jgi:hypothetical protein